MKNFFLCGCLLCVALWFFGCEKPPQKALVSMTGDSQIQVHYEGKILGALPLQMRLNKGKYLFRFSAPGYESKWCPLEIKRLNNITLPISLSRQSGAVLINSKPTGANLVVDEQVIGVTPLVLQKQPVGEYKGLLRMVGFSDCAITWNIEDARPKVVMVDMTTNIGVLEISSAPEKSRVFIDGRDMGITPYRTELTEGKYRLRLEKPGFSSMEQVIHIGKGAVIKKSFTLHPLPGGISITSSPVGSAVFVNNVKRAVTPCLLQDLSPAIYDIRVEKPGFDSMSKQIEVTAGFRDQINFQLQASTGSVELHVTPAGVSVLLDGKLMGKTRNVPGSRLDTVPISFSGVAPGKHEVELTHPRAVPVSRKLSITVEKGRQTRLKAISLWVVNCEIKQRGGKIEQGVLFHENENSIMFGPEPGVKGQINRSNLEYVRLLDDEGQDSKK